MTSEMKPLGEILSALVAKAPAEMPEPTYRCEECRDSGWERIASQPGPVKPCRCVTSRPIKERLRGLGVEAKLLGATLENLEPPRPDLSTFPEPDSCLCLMGPVGTGKSHTAVAILRDFVLRGKRCRYLPADQFIGDCRASYEDGGRPDVLIANLLRYELIVLDEAYGDRKTDFADDVTSLLIRRCLREQIPLVVTTNQGERELMQIEPKIASRVTCQPGSGALAYDYTGRPDFRRVAAPQKGEG